jgi:hypothetical protein
MSFNMKRSAESATFDKKPHEHKEKTYDPIPDGVHKVAVIESEYEQTEKANQISVTFQIDDESSDFNKQRVWARFFLESDVYSDKAIEIGQLKLAELCYAAGVFDEEAEYETHDDYAMLAAQLIGSTLFISTKQREYNNKVYVDAKEFFTSEGDNLNGKTPGKTVVKKATQKVSAEGTKPKPKPKFG